MEPDKKDRDDETGETVRISLESDPVEQRRICQSCYWRGRADASFLFVCCILALFGAYAITKVLFRVAE
jgi:hypothetical protein